MVCKFVHSLLIYRGQAPRGAKGPGIRNWVFDQAGASICEECIEEVLARPMLEGLRER